MAIASDRRSHKSSSNATLEVSVCSQPAQNLAPFALLPVQPVRFSDALALPVDPAPALPHHLLHPPQFRPPGLPPPPTDTDTSHPNLCKPQKSRLAEPSRRSSSPASPRSYPTSLLRYTTATALSISFPRPAGSQGPTPATQAPLQPPSIWFCQNS